MKKELNTKEKVVSVLYTVSKNDSGKGYNYFKELVNDSFSNDDDYQTVTSKLDNLMVLLEEKGYDYLSSLDFEEEIWEMI